MCEHCTGTYGKDMQIHESPRTKLEQPNKAQIIQLFEDEPGLVLFNHGTTVGYFDIKYCPMCGRKLVR